jgi:hypothetical protein
MKKVFFVLLAFISVSFMTAIADDKSDQWLEVIRTMQEQIKKQTAEIESLRKENQSLRQQLMEKSSRPDNVAVQPAPQLYSDNDGARIIPQNNQKTEPAAGGYWLSNTGKRHNSRCRYFRNCNGRPCGKNDGVACKICGG